VRKILISYVFTDIQSEDSVIQYNTRFTWSRSTFKLHMRRKYLYYIIHLIVPYCLFSLIAVLTFILQPSRPERLTLGMAVTNFIIAHTVKKSHTRFQLTPKSMTLNDLERPKRRKKSFYGTHRKNVNDTDPYCQRQNVDQ